jgi:hypothetical protein
MAMKRRSFLLTAAPSKMRVGGANDRVRAGIIGAGGRGRYLIGQFKEEREAQRSATERTKYLDALKRGNLSRGTSWIR